MYSSRAIRPPDLMGGGYSRRPDGGCGRPVCGRDSPARSEHCGRIQDPQEDFFIDQIFSFNFHKSVPPEKRISQKTKKCKNTNRLGLEKASVLVECQIDQQEITGYADTGTEDKMSRVGIFLADGFEEIEGLTVVDILRKEPGSIFP